MNKTRVAGTAIAAISIAAVCTFSSNASPAVPRHEVESATKATIKDLHKQDVLLAVKCPRDLSPTTGYSERCTATTTSGTTGLTVTASFSSANKIHYHITADK